MAIFSIIGTAIAGALFGGSVLAATLISAGLAFATKTALSYINRAKKRAYSAVQGTIQFGAKVPAGTVYGTAKVAGHRVFYAKWGKGNRWNTDVFILANGWCDGLEPYIYFQGQKWQLQELPTIGNETARYCVADGGENWDEKIFIRFYDGRPGQQVDQELVNRTANLGKKWGQNARLSGYTYVVVDRRYSSSFKTRPKFEFVLRGLREYDPRFDSTVAGGSGPQRLDDPTTWRHTNNPAIHRLNYLLGLKGLVSGRTLIGVGYSPNRIDFASHMVAATVCDTLRNGKPTYACSLYVEATDDHLEILAEFEDAMAGYAVNRSGLAGVIPGAPQIPVLEITAKDIRGEPQSVKYRRSAFDTFNVLSGQFTSIESMWNEESLKTVTVNADVAADGRKRQKANDFLQVTDPDIAQYLLNIRYRQNRKAGQVALPVSRRVGAKVAAGDWVTWNGRTWLVTKRGFDERVRFRLELSETGADVYSQAGIEPGPIVNPPQPAFNPDLLSTVSNFKVFGTSVPGEDGNTIPAIRFTWDPPDDETITDVVFEYQDNAGSGEVFTDSTPDPERGEYTTTKNVGPGIEPVARATIRTWPPRVTTWTPYTLSENRTGSFNVKAYLENLGADVYERLQQARREFDDIRARVEQLAQQAAEGIGDNIDQKSVARRYRDATASAMSELNASIEKRAQVFRQPGQPTANADGDIWIDTNDDNFVRVWNAASGQWEDAGAKGLQTFAQDEAPVAENLGDLWMDTDDGNRLYRWNGTIWAEIADERIVALASDMSAVQATVGNISGNGLWKMEVQAGTGDVVARAVLMMRATIAADWVEVGTVWEAGFTGGDPSKPFARQTNIAAQFIFTDGTNEFLPVVIENGGITLDVARMRQSIVELFMTPSGKTRYGVLAPGVEGLEIIS